MKIELQNIALPNFGKIIKHEFYSYDPENEFTPEKNLFYLTEDLLQIEFIKLNLILDLGWYGDIGTNKGSFKIFLIKNKDWENPIKIESSKSQKVINTKLNTILDEIKKTNL